MKLPAPIGTAAPCADCPFRNDDQRLGLRPGRVEGIVADLLANDRSWFPCHKTTDRAKKQWRGCRGAMVYLWKVGRPNVATRMGLAFGLLTIAELDAQTGQVIGPDDLQQDAP